MVIALLLSIAAFEWNFEYMDDRAGRTAEISPALEILDIPPTAHPPVPIPVMIQTIKPINTATFVEALNIEKITDQPAEILDQEIQAPTLAEHAASAPPEEDEAEKIFLFVESPPEFVGGQTGLLKFIKSNMTYPMVAKRMEIEGRVFVQAVIERDGSISNAKVVKSLETNCDAEALRVINSSPKWIPGKQRGKPVKVQVVIPIVFKLRKEGFVLTH